MMRRHGIGADPLGEMMRNAFREASRIDEDECRPMLANERGDAVVNFVPELVRRDWPQLAWRHFNRQIEMTPAGDLDDCGRPASRAGEEAADELDGFLRGR